MPGTRLPGPRPRKALGQHFLRDTGVLLDIARAVRPPRGGVVLEIGPGTGQLTEYLLAEGHTVVGLEIEERLISHLQRRFGDEPRLRVVPGDARVMDPDEVVPLGTPYSVAGNLPYFAANPIIRRLLEARRKASELVVMVQREVAREICAPEGDWSLLTISVRVYAEPEMLFDVAPEAFDPPPAVVSSVVRMTVRDEPLVPPARNAAFFEFVSKVFRNPRKQIHNGLKRSGCVAPDLAGAALERAAIDPMRRPETLTIAEWLGLMDACDEVSGRA